ncbi:hypothetical protein PACTADRAFT_17990 [Pachysolen tannophilus NRRL Y-2460]|uniref:Bile pigment transporter 1 n=1 Tax=Pachysolen tannophilus NRRL Y-2460 TaxID=669874 RepID=A0A1E4TRC0_PACTA|nr:hypothetical protein PACTADRAFT_17990 [Pachysolen tannophilus NRRL Y-2460]
MQSILKSVLSGDGDIEVSWLQDSRASFNNSCASIWTPLASPVENSINPCFIGLVLLGLTLVFNLIVICQLFQKLVSKKYGSFLKLKSCGINHWIRINLVVLASCLYLILSFEIFQNVENFKDVRFLGTLVTGLSIMFLYLPLHTIETSRSIIASGSLLYFWPSCFIINLIIVIQEFCNGYSFINTTDQALVKTIELLLLIVNIAVIILEDFYYSSTRELIEYYMLNELDIHTPNAISRITFTYMDHLIKHGYKTKKVTEDDLPDPPTFITSRPSFAKLNKSWNNQKLKNPKNPSLTMVLVSCFGVPIFFTFVLELIQNILSFAEPQLLKLFIEFFNAKDKPLIIGFFISVTMFVVSVLDTIIFNVFFLKLLMTSLSAKSGLMRLIYDKALLLSPEAKKERTTGDIVNLLSVDVGIIQTMLEDMQFFVIAPIKFILCLISIYYLLGNAVWGGVLALFIIMPINTYLTNKIRIYETLQMDFRDKRTGIVNEILSSMKSIKLYAWEKPMLKKLNDVRNGQELKNLKKISILNALMQFTWHSITLLVSCSTFLIYVKVLKKPLTPDVAFPALSLFSLLKDPIYALPACIKQFIEFRISLGRVSSYLTAEEINDETVKKLSKVVHLGDQSITISNATFLWNNVKTDDGGEEQDFSLNSVALKNIEYDAKKGELSCIVGKVGAGKSTFLKSLLGELPMVHGSDKFKPPILEVHGSIAYCPQVAWIMNASIRENILFGHKFEEDFYELALDACDLKEDLKSLPDGDETMVGEKGIALSGGQKARISLCRALYSRADIYILDDILSAVDAHVGAKITRKVLSKDGLLASKTRILATNSVTVLSGSDNIVLLEGGEIIERGSYQEVVGNSGSKLSGLIKEYGANEQEKINLPEKESDFSVGSKTTSTDGSEVIAVDEIDETDDIEMLADNLGTHPFNSGNPNSIGGSPLERIATHQTLRRASVVTLSKEVSQKNNKKNIITAQKEETAAAGKVKLAVYMSYAKACNIAGVICYLSILLITGFSSILESFWLKYWAENNSQTGENSNSTFFLSIYAALGITTGVLTAIHTAIMWAFCAFNGSKVLHDKLARSIMRSPMSFFETTPIGRIMNRFSDDINKVDEQLPNAFDGMFYEIVSISFTIAIVAYNLPMFLVIFAILSILYIFYQAYFVVTSRELKRIVSISRSPVFSHLSESVGGAETIRAFNQKARFIFLMSNFVDFNLKSLYSSISINRWLSVRLQFIGSLVILASSALAILSLRSSTPLSPGLIGLVMSYALQVTFSLNAMVRLTVNVEVQIVSVERINEYCDIKPEAESIIENKRPPAYWPSVGAVKFKHYTTRYREDLDPVLNDITLDIKPQEKIGIVGRTGAGKSTMAMALFRLIEATDGCIEIDGFNIGEIGLHDLRKNLSIIPQDSQAFEGTIRSNLDPISQYSDEELWKVLELAHLKDHVLSMVEETNDSKQPLSIEEKHKLALESKVAEGGSNLSVGQRQLMCLARALLNSSKVLILDEATAAVDLQTDKVVQETIRSEFKDRTILTIAHRLDTVMDSDRILVLEKGKVMEFEDPKVLLENKNSLFYKLCEQGGYLS